MNVLLLVIAAQRAVTSCASAITCVFVAIGLFCVEMQLVTWAHAGTARTLLAVNTAAAIVSLALFRRRRQDDAGRTAVTAMPWPVLIAVAAAVLALNVSLPLAGADPYHLERVAQIERLGSLAYDPAVADVKVNILAGVYELLLADLHALPLVGTAVVGMHGLVGLLLFGLAIGAAFEWLGTRSRLGAAALLTMPVMFHQYVLVKNDLFGAMPAFIALTWLVTRGKDAPPSETAWASWLAGFAVGTKLSTIPVATVLFLGVAILRRRDWRALLTVTVSGIVGAVSAGLLFTLLENSFVYGSALGPYQALGNRNVTVPQMLVGVGRFAISLGDFGIVTRAWWPGRGGWGGTFGLSLLWAIVVLWSRRSRPEARRALWVGGGCFLMFALTYPDADIAHRLMLAPGLVLVAVAIACAAGTDRVSVLFRHALVAVVVLSVLQDARSAVLYERRSESSVPRSEAAATGVVPVHGALCLRCAAGRLSPAGDPARGSTAFPAPCSGATARSGSGSRPCPSPDPG
jgi:hypothetical protein